MGYAIIPFAEELLRARTAKGWSQRELSAKARVPQAQISRIERGVVDLRLSTLLELARLLDLDVTMVPRSAASAVRAVIRESGSNADLRSVLSAATVIRQASRVLRVDHADDPAVVRLTDLSRAINDFAPFFQTEALRTELAAIATGLQSEVKRGADRARLSVLVDRLAELRNRLVHFQSDAERPAYSLDDED